MKFVGTGQVGAEIFTSKTKEAALRNVARKWHCVLTQANDHSNYHLERLSYLNRLRTMQIWHLKVSDHSTWALVPRWSLSLSDIKLAVWVTQSHSGRSIQVIWLFISLYVLLFYFIIYYICFISGHQNAQQFWLVHNIDVFENRYTVFNFYLNKIICLKNNIVIKSTIFLGPPKTWSSY